VGILDRAALRATNRLVAPLMAPGEAVIDYEIASVGGSGNAGIMFSQHAIYLGYRDGHAERLPYQDIRDVTAWGGDESTFTIWLFSGRQILLTCNPPVRTRPVELIERQLERLVVHHETLLLRDGLCVVARARPVAEGRPPVWLLEFPDDRGVERYDPEVQEEIDIALGPAARRLGIEDIRWPNVYEAMARMQAWLDNPPKLLGGAIAEGVRADLDELRRRFGSDPESL
jgi:hypothetical protein